MSERDLLIGMLLSPVGYDVGLFGALELRPTDQGVYCVAGELDEERTFTDPAEAVDFFLELRHKYKLGGDYELLVPRPASSAGGRPGSPL